ncbi:MAG: hypothetical protein V4636_15090 [Pseudomonadota bacterium]
MRRLLLVFMMLIVSLQSTWAAVGELCAHESGSAAQHLGHHEHRHDAKAVSFIDDANAPVAFSDDVGDVERAQAAYHADCATCHGHGSPAAMAFADLSSPILGSAQGRSLYRRQLTDRTLDNPLRPPSPRLA